MGKCPIHQGVQKFSKIVINGSILTTKFAVGRLDKINTFRKKVCKITGDKKDAQGVSKWGQKKKNFKKLKIEGVNYSL